MYYNDVTFLVNSCDLYEDAWNPFFRLLQNNWPDCPQKIILNTESKDYSDDFFNVQCLHTSKNEKWSNRLLNCLNRIDTEFVLFFLEDFFLEDKVNSEIFKAAYDSINANENIGVIKFIPGVSEVWYKKDVIINKYFSPVPLESKNRSNLMISLYRKEYLQKLLRKNESPWDFEKFGTYRSRRYPEDILIQTNMYPLAFPYNYQIKNGYGISNRQWLPKNKELFKKYGIEVDFEKLGWYDYESKKKITGLRRSRKEKILLPFTDPKMFWSIVKFEMKNKAYLIRHFRNYF